MIKPDQKYKTVAQLLASPRRWTQRSFARDTLGFACAMDSPRATKFCLLGGIALVYGNGKEGKQIARKIGKTILEIFPKRVSGITNFNDDPMTTHEDILDVLNKAKV